MEEFLALWAKFPELLNEKNYDKIRKNWPKIIQHKNNSNFEEAVCDICLEGDEDELENGNPDKLLIWDVWYVVVHQGCYQRDIAENVPEGDWVCQRCLNVIFYQKWPKWKYCSDPQGAIVKCILPNAKKGKKLKKNQTWVHIGWVNWITGIWFEGEILITQTKTESAGLKWKICSQKDWVCLQWDFKNWCESFHVRWAMRAGIIKADMDDQVDPDDEEKRFIFCKKHQIEGIKVLQTSGYKGLEPDIASEIDESDEETEKRRIEKLNKRLQDLKTKVKHIPKQPRLPNKLSEKDILQNTGFNNTNTTKNWTEENGLASNASSIIQKEVQTDGKYTYYKFLTTEVQLKLLTKASAKLNGARNTNKLGGKTLNSTIRADMLKGSLF